jgi:hypothetical protein
MISETQSNHLLKQLVASLKGRNEHKRVVAAIKLLVTVARQRAPHNLVPRQTKKFALTDAFNMGQTGTNKH